MSYISLILEDHFILLYFLDVDIKGAAEFLTYHKGRKIHTIEVI